MAASDWNRQNGLTRIEMDAELMRYLSLHEAKLTMQSRISLRIILLIPLAFLSSCGTTRPEPVRPTLSEADYNRAAYVYAGLATCVQYGGLGASDNDFLLAQYSRKLAQHSVDGPRLVALIEQNNREFRDIMNRPGENQEAEKIRTDCQKVPALIAKAKADQLHDAQMATYAAQTAAARAQAEAAYAPQILQMQVPTFVAPTPTYNYQAPQVYSPQLGRGSDFIYCRQLGSYVTSCR